MLTGMPQRPPLVVSAYADDVSVLIRSQRDVEHLVGVLSLFQRASSAWVNCGKSETVLVGQWANRMVPKLPGNLSWGRQGLKVLGAGIWCTSILAQGTAAPSVNRLKPSSIFLLNVPG